MRDLKVEVGGRLTLDESSFTIRAGEKVGLVGRNGAGKTSLLRVLGGVSPPAGGKVLCQGNVGYLSQDPRTHGGNAAGTALSHILSGRGLDESAARLERLQEAMESDPTERNISRYSKAQEAFASEGGYAAESEVRQLAAGLGVAADRLDLAISVLSGGERRRVELARILYGGSDVLMLDEPTNHLDVDAKVWLMGYLRSYRGALLVVSHDLEILDASITRVLHLDEGELVDYKGTYSQYRQARARDEARQTKLAERQQTEIKRLSTLADSMRHQTAKRARVAKTMDKRVSQLAANAVSGPAKERKYRVRFPDPPHSGRVVVEAEGLSKSYGGPAVFEEVSFTVERGKRLLILGLNGAGKTSLLRILADQTAASAGQFRLGLSVSLGYYAQEHEQIRSGVAVLDHFREESTAPVSELRALLGMFGITGEMAFQDAGTLSGGEKTKVALALLVAGRHNLLLLDEPTNNLDPPSREAIGQALASWPGAMVVVSHDPGFVAELAPDEVLMMPDGTLDVWSDDLLDLVAMA